MKLAPRGRCASRPTGVAWRSSKGPVLFDGAPEAMITVIDRSGRKSTVSRGWAGLGLAWAPSGNEIWFTATRPDRPGPPHLHAVSLSGVERTVHRAPDWLVLHDISADGRVLLSRNTIRINIACKAPGDARERDLRWLLASSVTRTLTGRRDADLRGSVARPSPRETRCSFADAWMVPQPSRLERDAEERLSPDGEWVLAVSGENLVLLPTGAGAMVTLPKGNVMRVGARNVARRLEAHCLHRRARRRQAQRLHSGDPGRYSSCDYPGWSGISRAERPCATTHSVLGRVGTAWMLFPIQGGDGQPVPALRPGDIPLQWSHDGRYVYTVDNAAGPRPPAVDVFRVELATGVRVLWKTLTPSDPVGVEDMRETVVITPDAQSYCYSYVRRLGDLFVVDGLK